MDLLKPSYSDTTLLTTGKYKFVALCRIPPKYLLDIYNKENRNGKYPDQELIAYIEKNLERLKAKHTGKEVAPKLERVCEKFVYPSRKDAKIELKKIRKIIQEHKKPIREYECDKCGGWHLTSIPYEVWKQMNKQKTDQT